MNNLLRLRGTGLHTGQRSVVTLQPACGAAITLQTSSGARFDASLANVACCDRRVVLQYGSAVVQTPEHLLAALVGCGVYGARIVIDGPEIPNVDGSAAPFVDLIRRLPASRFPAVTWSVREPFELQLGEAWCRLSPGPTLQIDCTIEFDHPLVGRQRRTFELDRSRPDRFIEDIAPARTFVFEREVASLRARGLGRGGSLDSVLVFDAAGVLNTDGLRYPDEPVRHKILDIIGDAALVGGPLRAKLQLHRPSHRLVHAALRSAIEGGTLQQDQ